MECSILDIPPRKRALPDDPPLSSQGPFKAVRIEPSTWGSFETVPCELIIQILAYLNRPSFLSMCWLNKEWMDLAKRENAFRKKEEFNKFNRLIDKFCGSRLRSADGIDVHKKLQEIKRIHLETQLKIGFDLKSLSEVRRQLIELLKKVALEDLAQVELDSLRLPKYFEHLPIEIWLMKLAFCLQMSPEHEEKGGIRLYQLYLCGLGLREAIEQGKLSHLARRLKIVFCPQTADECDFNGEALELVKLAKEKSETDLQNLLLARIKQRDFSDPNGSFFRLNIKTDIFYALIYLNNIELAKEVFLQLNFPEIIKKNCYYFKNVVRAFNLLINKKRTNFIDECIQVCKNKMFLTSLVTELEVVFIAANKFVELLEIIKKIPEDAFIPHSLLDDLFAFKLSPEALENAFFWACQGAQREDQAIYRNVIAHVIKTYQRMRCFDKVKDLCQIAHREISEFCWHLQ